MRLGRIVPCARLDPLGLGLLSRLSDLVNDPHFASRRLERLPLEPEFSHEFGVASLSD